MAATTNLHTEAQEVASSHPETSDGKARHNPLRRVPAPLPWTIFLVCIMDFAERFVYLGLNAPLQNYIQRPYGASPIPGALGKGQSTGVALGDFFKFWSYSCTVLGAIVADRYLEKYKTILVSAPIYILGMIVLVVTSTPSSIKEGRGLGGLIGTIILVGLATGGIKSSVAPLCAEQNATQGEKLKVLEFGEVVIEDGKLTTARIFMWYYWTANVGALSSLITVEIEKHHSFWLAFLLPLLVFMVVLTIFVTFNKNIRKLPPQGSPIVDAGKTAAVALREGGFKGATPSALAAAGHIDKYSITREERYTDLYVYQVKNAILACKYFLLFPFYFVCWTQTFNNLISQAGQMRLDGTPNDLMQSLEIIFMLTFIPILDLGIYPLLRKHNIVFGPVMKVALGFFMEAASMTYACVLQHYIYKSPANSIGVWVQAPAYVLGSIGEIWVVVTGLEIAFLKAPENLKTFVSSIFWVTIAVGALIGIGLSPRSKNPDMVWVYGSLAVTSLVAGIVFFISFRDSIQGKVPIAVGVELIEADTVEEIAATNEGEKKLSNV